MDLLGWLWHVLNTPPPKPEFVAKAQDHMERAFDSWLMQQVVSITEKTAHFLLLTPVSDFMRSDSFAHIYGMMVQLGFWTVTPFILWLGYQVMFGTVDGRQYVETVGRLFCIGPIMIGFPWFARQFVSLGNNLAAALLDTIPLNMAHTFVPDSLELSLLIFVVVYVVLAVRLILYYAYRNFALVFLVLVAPILCVVWAFPGQSAKVEKWVKEIANLILTQIFHSLQLVVLMALTIGASGQDGVALLTLQVGALLFMLKSPDWLAGYLNVHTPDLSWSNVLGISKTILKGAGFNAAWKR